MYCKLDFMAVINELTQIVRKLCLCLVVKLLKNR